MCLVWKAGKVQFHRLIWYYEFIDNGLSSNLIPFSNHTHTFRSGYGQDRFSLSVLEGGDCPANIMPSTPKWLPPRPLHSSRISSTFQSNQSTMSKRKNQKQARKSSEPSVIIWYEHISKAGGTTFCALANSNMRKSSVPKYHCMPRKGKLMDGRVGSWSNEELVEFINENEFKIVANEWDPFDVDKLQLSGRDLYGDNNSSKQQQSESNLQTSLLFVTTLRDPADRLLSSYSFFSENSEGQQRSPINFGKWMKNNLKRVGLFKIGQKSAFRSNIARNNYMVWRFSGGKIPNLQDDESIFSSKSQIFPSTVTDKSVWGQPFEVAVRSLSQHDLILPMDVMTESSGKESLQQILGWTQFAASGRGIVGQKESGHVVTTGEVRNSNAKSYLEERGSGEEFKALWERNWLDYILWYWARAVFFARLYCNVE